MIQEVVHQDNNLWYFWEETWAFRQGPFPTRREAQNALNKYCIEELGISDITKTHSFKKREIKEP